MAGFQKLVSKATTRKAKFLENFSGKASLDDKENNLAERCKFNFSYFCCEEGLTQKFSDLNENELAELFEKLKDFSNKPLQAWVDAERLARYDCFPNHTKIKEPKHVPHQAEWCRFRLEAKFRLIGFVLPSNRHGGNQNGYAFDKNVFYVVFLDKHHNFWPIQKRNT